MTELPKVAKDLIQSLREKPEIKYEGKWDVKVDVPDFGIRGEKFKVKSSKKVDYLQCVISQASGCKWIIPNQAWNRDGDHELVGIPIFNVIGKDVDKIEVELKDGRMFNGEFINSLPVSEYLIEVRAHTREAGEEVTIRKIIQIVENKKDVKKIKPIKEKIPEFITSASSYKTAEDKSLETIVLDETNPNEDFNQW